MTSTSSPPRRLRRSTTDRRIAGVAGGVGQYLGIDAVLVRVVLVLAVFAGGTGLLAYAVAWLVIPKGDGTEAPIGSIGLGDIRPETVRIAGIVVLLLAGVALIDGAWPGDLLVPAVLVGVGAWLLLRPDREDDPPGDGDDAVTGAAAGDPTGSTPGGGTIPPGDPDATSTTVSSAVGTGVPVPPPPASRAWPAGGSGSTPPSGAATATVVPPPVSRPAPSGPPTGRVTAAVIAIVVGCAWLAGGLGASVDPEAVLLGCLALCGVGLVVGGFTGRARGLLILVVPLVAALSLTSALDARFEGGFGQRGHEPTSLDELRDAYRLTGGELDLDLTGIGADDLRGATRVVDVSVGVGEVRIAVPDDVTVRVVADVRLGELELFGIRRDGTDLRDDVVRRGPEGTGTLEIRIDVGAGDVTVR